MNRCKEGCATARCFFCGCDSARASVVEDGIEIVCADCGSAFHVSGETIKKPRREALLKHGAWATMAEVVGTKKDARILRGASDEMRASHPDKHADILANAVTRLRADYGEANDNAPAGRSYSDADIDRITREAVAKALAEYEKARSAAPVIAEKKR